MRIFLAGATGAIGTRLAPLLLDAGHHVVGTTRSAEKADRMRRAGVECLVVDVFDAPALSHAVARRGRTSWCTSSPISRTVSIRLGWPRARAAMRASAAREREISLPPTWPPASNG